MTTLTPSQLRQLRLIFSRADKTGAGSLSASQVATIIRHALTPPPATTSGAAAAAASTTSAINPLLLTQSITDLLTSIDVTEDGSEGRCDFEEFVGIFGRTFNQIGAGEGGDANAGGGIDDSAHREDEEQGGSSTNNKLSCGLFLSSSELTELKSIFSQLDIDSDSLLSAHDLHTAFLSVGEEYSLDELECIIREVDNERCGKIKLHDFLAAMSPAA